MLRARYLESLIEHRSELISYCSQPLDVANHATLSDAAEYLGSKAFDGWKKLRDHDTKLQMAIIERLDVVVKAQNATIKAIGQLARR